MAGYRVLEARDGIHALEVARACSQPIDILVTDVVMPRMGGPELARRLSDTNPGMAVLFMSGWAESEAGREVSAAGPVLAKPFLPGQLLRTVASALDRHNPRASVDSRKA